MADHAISESPLVQRQLDRLATLSPGADILGLERIRTLLSRLGNPERKLPPVFHVAGTNGKGSTCAFLRAAIEASDLKAHVYTSPHLVRFNERIRIAGRLIEDGLLAELLAEVLDVATDVEASFFEVTTAAAFLAFARSPADACIIEVGLGGRLDATNVIDKPAVCGIAQLGLDHQQFLGDTIDKVAAEKAGIAKPGVPLVTQLYPGRVGNIVGQAAQAAAADWLPRGGKWDAALYQSKLHYSDVRGKLELPLPHRLHGTHQAMNAGLAIAMLRHQDAVTIREPALRASMGWAEWPARLQRLAEGPLHALAPKGTELWLDGGHNPAAARAVADFFRIHIPSDRPFHVIFGLLENKDAKGVLKPFGNRSITLHAIPVAAHAHHIPSALAAMARGEGLSAMASTGVEDALGWIKRHADRERPPIILIMGSLYLAGEILKKNGQPPS
ncbi:MAG: bifunctional folylpolyglutamate synthase/dihydrofolate synthase [Sphingosinicella sp.]|nr:bifunctional folylpolyglutamate synthase/dihydrofolate synthase [Sphingosinicella sp.]